MLCTIKVLSVVHNQGSRLSIVHSQGSRLSVVHNQGSVLSVVHNQGIAGYPYIVGPLLPMHNGTIVDGPQSGYCRLPIP